MDQLLINPELSTYSEHPYFSAPGGGIAAALCEKRYFARYWALVITAFTALLSIPLVTGFDRASAKFQFVEQYHWLDSLNINYILGIDGISILLVLLTTFIMPLCVLASWRYIKTRVQPS